ncbi:hypothetical protein IWX92DRAFT_368507 [Phyllosticta citricarpa]
MWGLWTCSLSFPSSLLTRFPGSFSLIRFGDLPGCEFLLERLVCETFPLDSRILLFLSISYFSCRKPFPAAALGFLHCPTLRPMQHSTPRPMLAKTAPLDCARPFF